MAIRLGSTVRDRVTGFKGVVTGRVEYITGCNQLLVAPPAKADGSSCDSGWYDEQRVEVDLAVPVIEIDNGTTPGADMPAPRR